MIKATCSPPKTVACGQAWTFDVPTPSDECVFDSLVYDNSVNDLLVRFNPEYREVGDEIVLTVDANMAYDYRTAVTMAEEFLELGARIERISEGT